MKLWQIMMRALTAWFLVRTVACWSQGARTVQPGIDIVQPGIDKVQPGIDIVQPDSQV